MRGFLAGVADLGRGFRCWATSPRLMLLGAVPALLVGIVWAALLVWFVRALGPIADGFTPWAADWAAPWRDLIRTVVGAALLVVGLAVAVLTYTAVVLVVGDPFYERISRAVELRLGEAPPERPEPLLQGLLRTALDGLILLLASIGVAVLALLLGLIPGVGPVLATVVGAVLGGHLLAVELTGTPLSARGLDRRGARAARRSRRGRALGFGVATWLLFLIPLGAVVAMPAAVAGAVPLARAMTGSTPSAVGLRPGARGRGAA